MTNEEKAINIRAYLTSAIMADGKTKGLNLLSERNKRCADLINIYKLIETSALQAMQWKDEELKNYLNELLAKLNACEKDRTREATIIEIIKGHFFKNVDLI